MATRIDFVKAFLENRVESFETLSPNRRGTGSDNAVAGTTPNVQSDKAQASKKKNKSVCGVVGSHESTATSFLLMLLLAALPLAVNVFSSRKSKS